MKTLNSLVKLTNFKIYIIFFFLITLLLTNCNKKEAYFFYYKDYYSLFKEEEKIHNTVKKYFYRNFYNVNTLLINSLGEIPPKLDQLGRNNTNGVLYLESHFSPYLLKNTNFKNSKLKLLTYDNPPIQINSFSISAFNIQLDPIIIEKKIILLFNKLSNNNLKNCSIILNSDYNICTELNKYLHNNPELDILLISEIDYRSKIRNWLSSNNNKIILFYGYNVNKYLKELEKDEYKGFIFIEALTNYGEVFNVVNYRFDIKWNDIVLSALESSEFKKFLTFDKSNQNLKIINYISKYKNPIKIKKYNKFKTAEEIIIDRERKNENRNRKREN